MNASQQTPCQDPGGRRWLVLVHQLPPKPDYVRVKIRRRLHGIGAVQLKASVYALPASDDALEDCHWLLKEIRSLGGSAMLCCAQFLEGVTDEEIDAMGDFEDETGESSTVTVDRADPGTTWVTRVGVKVDRIASAWLIRRFIDEDARFKFAPARGYRARAGERRFDMFEAEYTHEGDRCTFQTLQARFGLHGNRALTAIGEIVHDIDCKDQLFDRPETAGIDGLVRGIVASTDDDAERLERGAVLFDDCYRSMRGRRPAAD